MAVQPLQHADVTASLPFSHKGHSSPLLDIAELSFSRMMLFFSADWIFSETQGPAAAFLQFSSIIFLVSRLLAKHLSILDSI